jgi:uncharacterized membrane protein
MQEGKAINPYIAGILAGFLMILSVVITEKYFGASTTFVRSAGMIEKVFIPEHVKNVEYFNKKEPKIDWQFMFVVGIFLGSFLSSIVSRNFKLQAIPDMWEQHFGPSRPKRFIVAFIGGIGVMFGARLAGG